MHHLLLLFYKYIVIYSIALHLVTQLAKINKNVSINNNFSIEINLINHFFKKNTQLKCGI